MSNIKILDCTLRDGGYINNWDFGNKKAKNIINFLLKSNIDYIEIGFLKNNITNNNKTLFSSIEDTKRVIDNKVNAKKICVMIMYNDFDIKKLINENCSNISNIRLSFKKNDKTNALKQAQLIKKKGYRLFLNPTYINQYNKKELINLIKSINTISPYCFSLVDTLGALNKGDIKELYNIAHQNLNKDIALDFHTHNNLELSFLNTREIIDLCTTRELIIDTSLLGMGRGAGNLHSELMAKYLNDTIKKNYDVNLILKVLREEIYPIYISNPWENSIFYYYSAINKCHPNYAKYLEAKEGLADNIANEILKSIPKDKKTNYDENLIKELYFKKINSDKKALNI